MTPQIHGCLLAVVAYLVGASAFLVSRPQAAKERVLIQKDVSGYAGQDMALTVREIELAPGSVGTRHRHPGPVVVYVLSGDVEVHLDGRAPMIIHAGETFSEDARQLHLSTRNVSTTAPARLLSYIISRNGEALTQPAQ